MDHEKKLILAEKKVLLLLQKHEDLIKRNVEISAMLIDRNHERFELNAIIIKQVKALKKLEMEKQFAETAYLQSKNLIMNLNSRLADINITLDLANENLNKKFSLNNIHLN